MFPDNSRQGTLETVLLECAEISYPTLLTGANAYVDGVDLSFKSAWGVSDKNKVVVGCIANVLRPGKANQVSIQDNDWICSSTLTLKSVDSLNTFVKNLLDLP